MKQILLATLYCLLLFPTVSSAQYATINYDYERNYFGENQPLPAETDIIFTGEIPEGIHMIEVSIYNDKGKEGREPLKSTLWRKPPNSNSGLFNAPVNYSLKSGKKYDITINYYKHLSDAEKEKVFQQLSSTLDAYLDQTLGVKKKTIKLNRKTREIIADMNEIVTTGLDFYRSPTVGTFPGFSDIVHQKIDNLESRKLSEGAHLYDAEDKETARRMYRKSLTDDLKKMVHSEVRFVMNHEMGVLTDVRRIDDYRVEDKPSWFTVNVGYGGVYLDGKLDNTSSFGNAPYAGIGVPLSTSSVAPRFLRNASLSVGLFLKNFENDEREEISGPVFNRPIYAGLDYRIFQFVSLNVGASILEGTDENNDSDIFIRPFLGVSARINISMSLGK